MSNAAAAMPRSRRCEAVTALAIRAQDGDAGAMDELYDRVKSLLWTMAGRFRAAHWGGSHDIDDLYQAAYLGFRDAVDRFDRERGTAFATALGPSVRNAMGRQVSSRSALVRVPEGLRCSVIGGRTTPREEHLAAPARAALAPVEFIGEGCGNFFVDHRDDDADRVEDTEAIAAVWAAVEKLPEREARVIRLRYDPDRPLTLHETGRELGVTRERARQIENVAMARIRKALGVEVGA